MIDFRNCDCMALMAEYEDNHFDLAIVDPPYGIDVGKMNMGFSNSSRMEKKVWDNEPPTKNYFDELFRVSKNQIIWGANHFVENIPVSRGWIYWDKGGSFKNRSFSEGELAFSSFDKVLRSFTFSPIEAGRIHKCQKPINLYTWILSNYANEGDKILDTMVGSASSLIACHKLGFDVVGCELDEEYYKMAQQRIKEETAQLSLF